MGAQWKWNKFRQAANIFLTLALVSAAAGVFIYFFTTPENRGATFWMSMGLLFFAGVLSALFATRTVYSDSERQPPHTFTQLMLAFLYAAFVIAASVADVFVQFSVRNYFLFHVGGGVAFLLPLQFVNMAGLKSGEAKAAAEKARNSLKDESVRVQNVLSRLEGTEGKCPDVTMKLRKLADNLLYSEPTPASDAVERALSLAVDDLEARAELFLADPSASAQNALSEAVSSADRLLKARNDAVLRSK